MKLISELMEGPGSSVDIDPGFYVVTGKFTIGFGSWRMSFPKDMILEYKTDKRMFSFDPTVDEWVIKRPPISGEEKLDLSVYGYYHDQVEQLKKFTDNTKPISSATAKKLASAASSSKAMEKELTVEEAIKFLEDLPKTQRVMIKLI